MAFVLLGLLTGCQCSDTKQDANEVTEDPKDLFAFLNSFYFEQYPFPGSPPPTPFDHDTVFYGLVGHYPLNQIVFLLDSTNNQVHEVTTEAHYEHEIWDVGNTTPVTSFKETEVVRFPRTAQLDS